MALPTKARLSSSHSQYVIRNLAQASYPHPAEYRQKKQEQ